ncbi:Similar to RF_0381: Putative ankyrin repeat protein RF_0381 (Rickettsia felis (strain ATCC VR-1525 / URRWXCal2)) [Cotesia congregata]|uniref:Similar to RF_0381: Putative ankyrin repeat protein RF_0381 (Rickettsia felis (Strain ATCC VR-1525 / URRWXCal2)) n=1 Tax=Cotesia congregata TaxID=51543 RepID=A0A8J2H493_COTCN|nr:Similar to RF_0381: Putative ankyrin repeat protein RF_0381 (Rickettsia felis (strain ATCC VR-1525 / URRWXCal2)) [Cotesia congregata]
MGDRMYLKIAQRREKIKVYKENMLAATYEYRLIVRDAISNHQARRNSSFFEDKIVNNAPIETTGPFAGYTALHIACMEGNIEFVKLLVVDYHANVNAVADDGAQPIHLACFFESEIPWGIIDILITAGAKINAEIDQKLFTKYMKRDTWRNDFGNKISLFAFSLIYGNSMFLMLPLSFIKDKASLKVKSLKNKTLLMYAIESEEHAIALLLIQKVQDHEWINARDSNGYHVTHYILDPKNLENDRHLDNHHESLSDRVTAELIRILLKAGADVNATINNDPNTLLLNIAACKHFPLTLDNLLPYYYNISKSRALHYVLRPLTTPETESSNNENIKCIKLILRDLITRRTFGLFVPEDEKMLMDKLIAKNIYFREYAHTYEQNIIQGELKTRVLKYDDKSITYYEFIKSCFNDKQLRLIVKNKSLIDAFKNTFPNPNISFFSNKFFDKPELQSHPMEYYDEADYFFFWKQISIRIEKASRRLEQLEALERVENLCKAIPLPYELVITIVEYINYQDFKNFIQAFYL